MVGTVSNGGQLRGDYRFYNNAFIRNIGFCHGGGGRCDGF